MAFIVKRGMLKSTYKWEAPEQAGTHDALLFNRREGNEVVAMIQTIMDQLKLAEKAHVDRIEILIADGLPGEIRKKERVEQWLLEHLAPENGAINYVKSLSDGLGFSLSESSAPPEIFSVAFPPDADYEEVLDGLLDLARNAALVRSYGTTDHFDPSVDYFDTKGISPLFEGDAVSRQGWYEEVAPNQITDRLIYYNSETEEEEAVGEQIFDRFDELTNAFSGLVIYNDPVRYEENRAGVYILGGIDQDSSRLVGFMVQYSV